MSATMSAVSDAPVLAPTTAPEELDDLGHEVHVFGPPGTGKTTWLSGRIRSTVAYRGFGNVLVSSFTTAAAAELAGRGLPLSRGTLGTLHSHAYRAIDHPELAADHVDDFNLAHPGLAVTVTGRKASPNALNPELDVAPEDVSTGGATEGDALAAQMEALRNRMTPVDAWPGDVRRFAAAWEDWKRSNGLIDFTDMIEIALRDTERAPTNPQVGFFDEVQDNTALELALIRHWGRYMERIILAGDDDQMIYGFRGASPDGLLDHPVAPEARFVLGQSYRIPASVHRAAEMWIRRITPGRREDKPYAPRLVDREHPERGTYEGECVMSPLSSADVDKLCVALESEVNAGRTVMVLATCGYMLDPLKHALRRIGLPFHNPYRRKRGDWNPLGGNGRGVSSVERLLAYLAPDERMLGDAARLWTGEDVRAWSHVVKLTGAFRRGAKEAIKKLPAGELAFEDVDALLREDLDPAVAERVLGPDLSWFKESLLSASKAGLAFPIAVAERRGALALTGEPSVVIGTIHSVKGGQADTVFLIPDLSRRGSEEFARAGESRDGVVRQFYVGMTRAREKLVVLSPASQAYVAPARMIKGART